MSHELHMINGRAQMAYAGELPWHGLGTKVSNDLSAHEMLVAAGLDWKVEKRPLFYMHGDQILQSADEALVRATDGQEFCTTSKPWNELQNETIADFFHDFVNKAHVEMHTAGALYNGSHIWMLAKLKESFSILHGKDVHDLYMLFYHRHIYGTSGTIMLTPVRVVCNNTVQLALGGRGKSDLEMRFNHSNKFDVSAAQETMGLAREKVSEYQEHAEFLASKRASEEDIEVYFETLYPVSEAKAQKAAATGEKKVTRGFETVMLALEHQPGSQLGEGTWWQAFNSVTFCQDHIMGRTPETRLASNWHGPSRAKKAKALELALVMAGKSNSN